MINLKDFPKESGVYWFISNDEIMYVGSSKNLYYRMNTHNNAIKKGSEHGYKQDLYQFLQSNQFTVEFQLTDNYKELEQDFIEKYNPKYNSHRAFTGCGTKKGREVEWSKTYKEKYLKLHIHQYYHQLCSYNDEILTFDALRTRFRRSGTSNPTAEAKKYLIN